MSAKELIILGERIALLQAKIARSESRTNEVLRELGLRQLDPHNLLDETLREDHLYFLEISAIIAGHAVGGTPCPDALMFEALTLGRLLATELEIIAEGGTLPPPAAEPEGVRA